MVNRRRYLALAVGIAGGAFFPAAAQTPGRVYRLGILRPSAQTPDGTTALWDSLRGYGYVEGNNLVVERRFAGGQVDRLPALARELLAWEPDVLLCFTSRAAQAAREATSSIPILVLANSDLVRLGLVRSLARPEGNVTGVLISADGSLAGKRLELLREVVPHARRLALLTPNDPNFHQQLQDTQRSAQTLGLAMDVTQARGNDYESAFAAIAAKRPDALVVGAHAIFMVDRKPIIALAAKHRLPAVYEWPEQVREGGLLSYGASLDVLYGRLAHYAAQLFAGRKASDLPVEQPTTYRLVINRRTADALGLVLSPALLLRADEVIE